MFRNNFNIRSASVESPTPIRCKLNFSNCVKSKCNKQYNRKLLIRMNNWDIKYIKYLLDSTVKVSLKILVYEIAMISL